MKETQINLLELVSNTLFIQKISDKLSPDIFAEARDQTVSALITDDYEILVNNIRVITAHEELTKILEGIPFVTFKGYASAYYYPEPVKRTMGDVDFITKPEFSEECANRLIKSGYIEIEKEHERHRTLKKANVALELHSEIKGIPNGADGIKTASVNAEEKVRKLLDDLIDTRMAVKTNHGIIYIPDDFHHGLIMLLHVAGHIINDGGIGLRHLCDWAVYVNRVDITRYQSDLESIGLWTFACQLTALSEKYLGLPKQSWSGKWDDSFLERFLEDVLNAGNFGRKEFGRRQSLALKRDSFAGMTKARYPLAEKYKVLLPAFMGINIIRYGVLVVRGKRKYIRMSTISEAKERDNLYKQFKLFE